MDKNTFGERLRQERSRLNLTQEAFAAIGGVKKLAQINYEQGKTFPDAGYMIALSSVGVDITYVMLGVPMDEALTRDEGELLGGYRRLDVRSKARVLGVIEGLANPAAPTAQELQNSTVRLAELAPKRGADELFLPPARTSLAAPKRKFVNKGEVAHQVNGDIKAPMTVNIANKKTEK